MDIGILLEKVKFLCKQEKQFLASEEDKHDARCGDYGQWDDTYDAGLEHGRADLAVELLELIDDQD